MFILIVKQRWWSRVGRVGIYPPSIWTIKTEKTNATKSERRMTSYRYLVRVE